MQLLLPVTDDGGGSSADRHPPNPLVELRFQALLDIFGTKDVVESLSG